MERIKYLSKLVKYTTSAPTVSIWCVTYNHVKYIRDAIEGFLIQKTNFDVEIVIHDDASTDGTIDILMEYEKKYPKLIRVIYETENQYSKFINPPEFFMGVMRRELKGKYIALCEGDDYWTDINKLQVQIDYMESHLNCMMTAHNATIIHGKTNERKKFIPHWEEKDLSINEIVNESIPTASYVCRREALDIEDFFLDIDVGDYPLQLYCFSKGKIHYFDNDMCVYRYQCEGSWSSKQGENFCHTLSYYVCCSSLLEKYNKYTKGFYEEYLTCEIKRYLGRLNGIVQNCSDLSVEQFITICKDCDEASKYKMHKYYVELTRVFRQHYDLFYIDNRLSDFAKQNRYVFIWGAGIYGKLIAEQFNNNSIEFEGFVISDNQVNVERYQGKKVWKISELPYKISEIGIVIAIRAQIKEEVLMAIYNSGIERYIYPFDINVMDLLE